ncbi:hypothetical protein M436DRAFT_65398 [Aureobasidium namibiae CBS 147.97]|uniref:Uncharacterized protein n=1 Tax=Aureobasidium namibiae CBS 147.97 TaxID=1043004 RepID=A0A074X9E2_9PEZI
MPTFHPQNASKVPGKIAFVAAQCIVCCLVFVLGLLMLLATLCLIIEYFPWFLAIGLLMLIATTPELQQGISAAVERKKREYESKSTQTSEPPVAEPEAHMTPERPIKMSLRSGRLAQKK